MRGAKASDFALVYIFSDPRMRRALIFVATSLIFAGPALHMASIGDLRGATIASGFADTLLLVAAGYAFAARDRWTLPNDAEP